MSATLKFLLVASVLLGGAAKATAADCYCQARCVAVRVATNEKVHTGYAWVDDTGKIYRVDSSSDQICAEESKKPTVINSFFHSCRKRLETSSYYDGLAPFYATIRCTGSNGLGTLWND